MNVGSLFSGIGGIDLGLERAGMRVVWQCESDPWRREVLRRHWPDTPCAEDVADLFTDSRGDRPNASGSSEREPGWDGRATDLRQQPVPVPIDLLCGGFPCQDLSVAGRRAGLAGDRSSLFFEFARIAESLRPRWLLVENVPGLLSSNGGRDFAVVLATLAELGYGVCWRVLDSRFFRVPQRRRRVFIVGHLGAASAEPFLPFLEGGERHPQTRGEARPRTTVASALGTTRGGGHGLNAEKAAGNQLIPALTTRAGNTQDDQQTGQLVANALRSQERNTSQGPGNYVAAPLSHGSNPNSNAAGRRREDDENLVTGPLGRGNDGIGRRSEDDPNLVTAFAWQQGDDSAFTGEGRGRSWVARAGDYTGALSKTRYDAVAGQTAGVRRLTPTECCRLQGFPDDWLGEPNEPPDSPRYAALGDAVTVNVAQWIGQRILEAEEKAMSDDYCLATAMGMEPGVDF